MPPYTCPTCGTQVAEGVDRCPVCRSLVFPEEAAKLGIGSEPVAWSGRGESPEEARARKRKLVITVVVLGLAMAVGKTLAEFWNTWVGLIVMAAGAVGIWWTIRSDKGARP